MLLPNDLVILFQNATIVVDNARRPSISTTESAPTLPPLCRCTSSNSQQQRNGNKAMLSSHRMLRRPSCRWGTSEPPSVACSGLQRYHDAVVACNGMINLRNSAYSINSSVQSSGTANEKSCPLAPESLTTPTTDQRPRPPCRSTSSSSSCPSSVVPLHHNCGTNISAALQEAISISSKLVPLSSYEQEIVHSSSQEACHRSCDHPFRPVSSYQA